MCAKEKKKKNLKNIVLKIKNLWQHIFFLSVPESGVRLNNVAQYI